MRRRGFISRALAVLGLGALGGKVAAQGVDWATGPDCSAYVFQQPIIEIQQNANILRVYTRDSIYDYPAHGIDWWRAGHQDGPDANKIWIGRKRPSPAPFTALYSQPGGPDAA